MRKFTKTMMVAIMACLTFVFCAIFVGCNGSPADSTPAAITATYNVEHYFENLQEEYVKDASVTETLEADIGETVTANSLFREGYEIYNSQESVLSGTVKEDNSLVLKVYYKLERYTVTFDSDGGTEIESQIVKYGDTVQKPTDPEKGETSVFTCWKIKNGTNEYDFTSIVTSNLDLIAVYDAQKGAYKFEYYFENAEGEYVLNETYTVEGKVLVGSELIISGEYAGFVKVQNDNSVESGIVTKDGTLVLKAYYDIVRYTITFDSKGGSSVESQTVKYQETATEPEDPIKTDNTFLYWQFQGEEGAFDFSSPITSDITLIAVYEGENWGPIV